MTNRTEKQAATQDFAAVLLKLNKGQTHRELSDKLAELVMAVQEHSKPGRIQLTLEVKPIKGTDGTQVTIGDSVTAKIPGFNRPPSMFFVGDSGELSRNPIQQHALFEESEDR